METETNTIKPPAWYWVLAALALVWNGLGLFTFIMYMTQREALMAQMSASEQALISATPGWYWIAFGVAVFGGFLGCLSLLLRKMWACPLFLLSILGLLAQHTYTFFLSGTLKEMGMQAAIMPVIVLVIAILLFLFARQSRGKGWIG